MTVAGVVGLVAAAGNLACAWWLVRAARGHRAASRRLEAEFEHYRAQRRLFEHALATLEHRAN